MRPSLSGHIHTHRSDEGTQDPAPQLRSAQLALWWSVAAALAAVAWALDLLPHPFGDADQVAIGAVFNTSDPLVGTTVTFVLAIAGVACAVAMRRSQHDRGSALPSAPLIGAWAIVATLTLVLIHGSLLAFLGYTMVLPVLGWFEPALFPDFVEAVGRADTLSLLSATLGAVVWGDAAIRYRRARNTACISCGRPGGWSVADEAVTRARALRTGQVAVRVAVSGLLVYPAMRIPWLFGVRIGVDAETWAQLQRDGLEAGIALGLAGFVGALLITGLVRDWGVRVPRWMLGLAGRRVPAAAAVLPAVVVAIGFVALGRGTLVSAFTGSFAVPGAEAAMHVAAFGALLPAGLALAVAAAAYAVRRRARCGTCAHGEPEELPSVTRRGSWRDDRRGARHRSPSPPHPGDGAGEHHAAADPGRPRARPAWLQRLLDVTGLADRSGHTLAQLSGG